MPSISQLPLLLARQAKKSLSIVEVFGLSADNFHWYRAVIHVNANYSHMSRSYLRMYCLSVQRETKPQQCNGYHRQDSLSIKIDSHLVLRQNPNGVNNTTCYFIALAQNTRPTLFEGYRYRNGYTPI